MTRRPSLTRSLLSPILLLWGGTLLLCAEDVILRDGKVIRATSIRRDGTFLFAKVPGNEASAETVVPFSNIERLGFADYPPLLEVRQLATSGQAEAVLEKTESLLAVARLWADFPGTMWPEVARLRLAAIGATQRWEAIATVQPHWFASGDADLEASFKLLQARANGTEISNLQAAWKSLAQPGSSSLSTSLAWLELGEDALASRRWKDATRAFLSVEVFGTSFRILHPRALLGAIRALVGNGEFKAAIPLREALQTEFPASAETKQARELLPGDSSANPPSR